ncbi:pentapeptide repeat-containing protein [Nostoc parmelioides]|nr:pentapeptide repeat-containing protein [Nostoc parmelioides]
MYSVSTLTSIVIAMPQDFSHQNLRGLSFKGQNLVGVNFSYADIQGVDFSGANLRGANFSCTKTGLQSTWRTCLAVICLLLALISGVICAFAGGYLGFLLVNPNWLNKATGLLLMVGFAIFFTVGVSKSLTDAFYVSGLLLILAFTGGVLTSGSGTGSGAGYFAFSMIGMLTGVMLGAIAIAEAWDLFGTFTVLGVLLSTIFGALIYSTMGRGAVVEARFLALVFALIFIGFSTYIGHRILKNHEIDGWMRTILIFLATIGGTNFRNANLTDANFTGSILKSTDLRKANLTRTSFHKVNQLDRVLPGFTYLQNTKIHQLLITGQGQEQQLERQDLRGVNLQGANLADANFIGADLSQANLQDADLSRAKLVQTQLDGTDFTGAILTGAYIEDWGITTDTKFDGVRCEYVYMRLPTQDNPDPHRKPDNRQEVFADGEFGDFIQPIFDTLDLYHNQGVDPRAIAISFKELAENHPEAELEIVAMEKRGQDKILLRAKTATQADKSELSAEYFTTYNQLHALAQQELQALIAEKDSRISDLQTMVMTALQRPSFYAQTYQNQGDTVMSESSKQVFHNSLPNAQFGGGLVNADTVTGQQIATGNMTNNSPQQKQNLAAAATEIQQLLNQLSQTHPTTTTSEKMTVVAKVVDEIESNPTLKARVVGALKAGGIEAFKEMIDHPLVNILLASIDGWQEAE